MTTFADLVPSPKGRFDGIERPYTPEDVLRLRGSVPITHTLAERGANIAFCPSSNLFLGSGLFDRAGARAQGLNLTLASDIGAGTDLSGLATLKAAYQVGQLRGTPLTAWAGFHDLTRGNAVSLSLDDRIGSLTPGRDADFVVIDLFASPLLARRMGRTQSLAEELFTLMMLGDDRAIYETWAGGRLQHRRQT